MFPVYGRHETLLQTTGTAVRKIFQSDQLPLYLLVLSVFQVCFNIQSLDRVLSLIRIFDRCDASDRVHIASESATAMECSDLNELSCITPRAVTDCIHYAKLARSRPTLVTNSTNREDHFIAPIDQERIPDRLS